MHRPAGHLLPCRGFVAERLADTCHPLSITKGPAPLWRCRPGAASAAPQLQSQLLQCCQMLQCCPPPLQCCQMLQPCPPPLRPEPCETAPLLPSPGVCGAPRPLPAPESPRGRKKRPARSLPPCAPRCPEPGPLRFPPCGIRRSSASCRAPCRSQRAAERPEGSGGYSRPLRGVTECPPQPFLHRCSKGYPTQELGTCLGSAGGVGKGSQECPWLGTVTKVTQECPQLRAVTQECPQLGRGAKVTQECPWLGTVTKVTQECPQLGTGAKVTQECPRLGTVTKVTQECPQLRTGAKVTQECPRLGTGAKVTQECPRLGTGAKVTQECPRLGTGAKVTQECPPLREVTKVTRECPPLRAVVKECPQLRAVTKVTKECPPLRAVTKVTRECPRLGTVAKVTRECPPLRAVAKGSAQPLSRSRCPQHPRGPPRPSRLATAGPKRSGHSRKSRCASKWLW